MQRYNNNAQDTQGNALVSATVTVFAKGTTNKSTIYSDNGITPTGTLGVTTTDPLLGSFFFYAADGRYDIQISKTGSATQTLPDVLLFDPAASTGAAGVGFVQAGTGAVSRDVQTKLRERVSPEDFGCVGDGATDDRANFQKAIDAMNARGGGIVECDPSKTYLLKKKAGATKTFGDQAGVSYSLEIPNNVLIDLKLSTIKGEDGVEYSIVSNTNTANPLSASNTNLGIINGTIDCNQVTRASNINPVGLSFWGVRRLRLDQLEIKNGYATAIDLEGCDEFDIGTMVFRSTYGAAFDLGGSQALHGAQCSYGKIGSVTCYDTFDHPFNAGIPGNPVLLGINHVEIGMLQSKNADAGFKFASATDVQIGSAYFEDGNKINSGFKLQGGSMTTACQRVTIGKITSRNCTGRGLHIDFSKNISIGSYIGETNDLAGTEGESQISGEYIHIGKYQSFNSGKEAFVLTSSSGTAYVGTPSCTVDDMDILNPFSVSSAGSPTAIAYTNGHLKIGKLRIQDLRSTPTLARYYDGGRTKQTSLTVDEFVGRGATGSPNSGFLTGSANVWIGRPDISRLTWPAATLTLTSAAVGTGVTATASAGTPFASTDVGKMLIGTDGGFSEITAFTSTTVVTVANRVAWTTTTPAQNAWYISRAQGGWGSVTLAAATSTAVTDEGFANSNGNAIISFVPTNAAARTLGLITAYSWSGSTLTLTHPAAAGTETYQYRILGWMWP